MRGALGVIILLFTGAIQAAPLTWTLEAGYSEFCGAFCVSSSGTITGYFEFDANVGAYTATKNDSWHFETPFAVDGSISVSANDLEASDGVSDPTLPLPSQDYELFLQFVSPLTDGGGVVQLNLSNSYFRADLGGGGFAYWYFDSGTVTAVPIPAAVWLFASGLGLMGCMRLRRTH